MDEALSGLSDLLKIEVGLQLGERCTWEDAGGLGMGGEGGWILSKLITYMYEIIDKIALEMYKFPHKCYGSNKTFFSRDI